MEEWAFGVLHAEIRASNRKRQEVAAWTAGDLDLVPGKELEFSEVVLLQDSFKRAASTVLVS